MPPGLEIRHFLDEMVHPGLGNLCQVASPRAILHIPCYFAHRLQHLKMKENDNSENSMIKNNPFLV